MTDQTTHVPRIRRTPKAEFTVYFIIIFLATLPLATLTWVLKALRSGWPEKGPVARAWSQAGIITPMIFSAP